MPPLPKFRDGITLDGDWVNTLSGKELLQQIDGHNHAVDETASRVEQIWSNLRKRAREGVIPIPSIYDDALIELCRACMLGASPINWVVSNRWTGLLDWITGLTFDLKLCVSHDLHPIRCAELGHMFDANGLPKDAACSNCVVWRSQTQA